MKKLLLATILLLLNASICFGALNANTVWEVRTTGNSANGGGYHTTAGSTDYSQQDAAQWTGTDLACADHATFVVTSAGSTFTDVIEGNLMYISDTGTGGHFTVGYYEVVGYTDANTITLDRDPTDGNDEVAGDFKIGGAVDHPDTIGDVVDDGHIIYVQDGDYLPVGANAYVLQTTNNASYGSPVRFRGYHSARGDNPIGEDRPNFDANSSGDDVLDQDGGWYEYSNIIFENATDDGVDLGLYDVSFTNCSFVNNGDNGIYISIGWQFENLVCLFCEIGSNSGTGFYTGSSARLFTIIKSYIHDNTGTGIYNRYSVSQQGYTILNETIFDTNGGDGLWIMNDTNDDFEFIIYGNVFYNNTSDGINLNGNATAYYVHGTSIFNNVFYDNGAYGIDASYDNPMNYFGYNIFNDNTSGARETISEGINEITSDPSFTDAAGADFRYSSSSSPAISAGIGVDTYTSLSTDFNVNIGVDQGDHAVGGVSVTVGYSSMR